MEGRENIHTHNIQNIKRNNMRKMGFTVWNCSNYIYKIYLNYNKLFINTEKKVSLETRFFFAIKLFLIWATKVTRSSLCQISFLIILILLNDPEKLFFFSPLNRGWKNRFFPRFNTSKYFILNNIQLIGLKICKNFIYS